MRDLQLCTRSPLATHECEHESAESYADRNFHNSYCSSTREERSPIPHLGRMGRICAGRVTTTVTACWSGIWTIL